MGGRGWVAWHEQYETPGAPLRERLAVVQGSIRDYFDANLGRELKVISLCAGKGADLLEVLADHPVRSAVKARLIELDPVLVAAARATVDVEGLDGVEVVTGDAGVTDAYVGAVPADLVMACGILGNVSDGDVRRTVGAMPSLCATGGIVIWTRHRRPPDLTPSVRTWFADAGFGERGFASPGPDSFAVGIHQLEREHTPLAHGQRLFTFVR